MTITRWTILVLVFVSELVFTDLILIVQGHADGLGFSEWREVG